MSPSFRNDFLERSSVGEARFGTRSVDMPQKHAAIARGNPSRITACSAAEFGVQQTRAEPLESERFAALAVVS
jgi:hypothetical protein